MDPRRHVDRDLARRVNAWLDERADLQECAESDRCAKCGVCPGRCGCSGEGPKQAGHMVVDGQSYQANTQVWIDGQPYTIDTVEGDAVILLDESGNPRMMPLAKVVEGLRQGAPDKDAGRTAQSEGLKPGDRVELRPKYDPDDPEAGEQGTVVSVGEDDVTVKWDKDGREWEAEKWNLHKVGVRTAQSCDCRTHMGNEAEIKQEARRMAEREYSAVYIWRPEDVGREGLAPFEVADRWHLNTDGSGRVHPGIKPALMALPGVKKVMSPEKMNAAKTAQSWARPTSDGHAVIWFYHPGDSKPISEITAEVVRSPNLRCQGLQGRERLHPATGMLFLDPNGPGERAERFHMGTVKFPIDIMFVRASGQVGRIIHDIQPGDPGRWGYDKTGSVVEVVGGFCRAHGIQEGDRVGYGKVAHSACIARLKVAGRTAQLESGMAECKSCGWFAPRDEFIDASQCSLGDDGGMDGLPKPACPDCGSSSIRFASKAPKVGVTTRRLARDSEESESNEPPPVCALCGARDPDWSEAPGIGMVCSRCMDGLVDGLADQQIEGQMSNDMLRSITEASRKRAQEDVRCPACDEPVGSGGTCDSCGASFAEFERMSASKHAARGFCVRADCYNPAVGDDGLCGSCRTAAFPAKYPGYCRTCKQSFPAGTQINWRKETGSWHTHCSDPNLFGSGRDHGGYVPGPSGRGGRPRSRGCDCSDPGCDCYTDRCMCDRTCNCRGGNIYNC